MAHFATELVCFCYTKLSDMRRQFKVSFYLRSNYENKEGKSPIMLRIFFNREMANLGTTKLFVKKSMWNNSTSRMKGRTAEALSLNASLDSLSTSLYGDCCIKANRCVAFGIQLRLHTEVVPFRPHPQCLKLQPFCRVRTILQARL